MLGAEGDELDVDGPTAAVWADGVRAQLVRQEPVRRAVTVPVEVTVASAGTAGSKRVRT